MSRVGKLPVKIPPGVSVSLEGHVLKVKGPRGELERTLSTGVDVVVVEDRIEVKRRDESIRSRSLHGLTRALVNNMVVGAHSGFTKVLEIEGVGYRADIQGDKLNLTLGHSHPVHFPLPEGVKATVERQTVIRLESHDKELLGLTAAKVKALRPVEPYKGKGVRYADEQVRRKAGKAGKK